MNWLLIAGSLGGVLALAAIAWMLGLGGGSIDDEAAAMRIAEDALTGFQAEAAVVSLDRQAALVSGADGSLALLKAHGVHVAARRLARPVEAEREPGAVRIRTDERMFGDVRLRLDGEARDKLEAML